MLELPISFDDFDDFDDHVEQVKQLHLDQPAIPPTVVFIYHDRMLSAFIEPPMYCQETAAAITSTLARGLPTLLPHAVGILLPAAYDPVELDDEPCPDNPAPTGSGGIGGDQVGATSEVRAELWWAMKVFTWQRLPDGATKWRARLMPMPVQGSPDGPMMDLDEQAVARDPLAGPVRDALDRPGRRGWLVELRWLPDDWEMFARPGGRLDGLERLVSHN